ncbi:hypothetical protein Patl1_35966 [Pistacia atlantica]|nr:hypothetical protein Patl1_35966 [Pistacia atlantica]
MGRGKIEIKRIENPADRQRMQETYKKLKDVNDKLRKQIRQIIGEDLDDLSMDELCNLEQKMTVVADVVRERKYHVIKTQTDTYKKKEAQYEDPNLNYGLVDGGDYQSATALSNGASNLYVFHLYNANFPQGGGEGFSPNNLSLD